MANITVRTAVASDAEAIAKLGRHVFAATFGHSVSAEDLEAFLEETYTPAAISTELSHRDKTTLVATDESGAVKGFSTLTRNTSEPCVEEFEDRVELQRLYVDTSAHRKGVGSMLMRSMEALARREGFRNMWLGVWEENYTAMKAYQKWGYRFVGAHDFVVGSEVQTDLIMIKAL
ncbi:hypothetical protein VUR80DRAFT_4432 [Thermomyces stellatus]